MVYDRIVMKMPGLVWINFTLVLSSCAVYSSEHTKRLHTDLFMNYSKYVRPMRNQSEPTTMNISLYFILVHQLDMKTQILKSGGWLNMRWIDEFLKWDPADYGGTKMLTVPETWIWKPDLMPYNIVDGRRKFGSTEFLVQIIADGTITWRPDFILETRCQVDITYFPFGTQMCEIQLLSWELDRRQLLLTTTQTAPSLKWCSQNGEFDIKGSYAIVFKDGNADVLKYGIVLKRRILFYVFALVLPVILLSLLCIVSFLVPMESGERMTISMTTLLSFTVYMGVVDELMPKTSENISLLVVYITTLLTISLLTVVGNATVLFIYHRLGQHRRNEHMLFKQPEDGPIDHLNSGTIPTSWNNSQSGTQKQDSSLNRKRDSHFRLSLLEQLIGQKDTGNETGNVEVESKMALNKVKSETTVNGLNQKNASQNQLNDDVNQARKSHTNDVAHLVNRLLMCVTTFCLFVALLVVSIIVLEQRERPRQQ